MVIEFEDIVANFLSGAAGNDALLFCSEDYIRTLTHFIDNVNHCKF
jgi:hypothetical protein